MTKQVQLRRGTTEEHLVFTGAEGELTIDTTRDIAIVHDGVTPGGHELVGVANTNQTIVNKDGLSIGTSETIAPLTVIGNSYISGVSSFVQVEVSSYNGSNEVKIGTGNTDLIVSGNAKITQTLDTKSLIVNNLSAVGYGITVLELSTSLRGTVSAGATILPVTDITNVSVGDSLRILPNYYSEYVTITGLGTTASDTEFNLEILATSTAAQIGTGSTIIPLNSITGVSIGNSITFLDNFGELEEFQIRNAPIVGFTTVQLDLVNQTVALTSVSVATSTTDTIISVASTGSISIGNSFSAGYTDSESGFFVYTVSTIEIIGFTTVSVTPYDSVVLTTSLSDNVSIGQTVFPVQSTAGITTGNSIVIFGNDLNDNEQFVTITDVVTGFSTNTIIIGAATTVGVVSFSSVTVSETRTDGPAIELASPVGVALTESTSVIISQPTFPVLDAVLIGTGNTINAPISIGSSVGITTVTTTTESIIVSEPSPLSIPSGTTVQITRFQKPNSTLNIRSLETEFINAIGIATINGLTYPATDGVKGQVLVTDGLGNIGFSTGGAGGGGKYSIRVSKDTGNDDNDGKILPVRTIKKATQIASLVGEPVTVFVESGEYVEDNPIIVYDSVSVIGDSLRNIVVRPLNAGKDLFKVRNGCYISGMSFNDYVDELGVPQHTYDYSISFDDPYDTNIDRTGYAATYTSLNIIGATYDTSTGFTTFTTSSPHELAREYSIKLTGVGWTCGYDEVGISTFEYDHVSGVSTATLFSDTLMGETGTGNTQKGYKIGDKIYLHNLPFSCAVEHAGVTTTIFPDGTSPYGKVFTVTGINTASKTLTFNVGVSTIPHVYEGYGAVSISTFAYDHVSGIATATTTEAHGLSANDNITLAGLEFSCSVEHAGVTTTIFPDGTITAYSPDGYTFKVSAATTNTFTYNVGVSTIAHTYESGGTVQKVPTIQEVWYYPDYHKNGQNEFGVVSTATTNTFTIRGQVSPIQHYYTQGGTIRLSRPIINKSPYIQNCSILSSLGGNGILVDGDKIASVNKGIIPELGEIPVVGDQPEFGKSMVAATFTMISFGGIGWRTINDGYAQVVSCFQIFCRYGSLTQSGGYLSITNSATNFGDKALRSTGFSRNSFIFDRGRVVANGTQDGLQTLRVVGLGRSDQDLYVLRFFNNDGEDRTSLFKPLVQFEEFSIANVNTTTNVFNIPAHPFVNGDSIVYNGNEQASPPQVLSGLVNDAVYYVEYIDASNFRLFEDDSLRKIVDVSGSFTGLGTFTKNNQEFYNYEILEAHNEYQVISLAGVGTTAVYVSGRAVTQGSATGYAVTYSQTTKELIVSVESVGGTRNYFSTSTTLQDHSPTPISIGVTAVAGITTYWTLNFKVESTNAGNLIAGINSLTENYKLHLHRPSIINSSAHTWEYSGSGTDYNALPQNGGQSKPNTEQVSELGGRVYASGTNELGDFKIGTQITAFNRTGNIIFNNKVTIGELASIRLSLSGGVAVEEFSTDTGLGDNEVGGPKNTRVSTQLAVKSFLTNRLGSFIDKQVSTNAVPNSVVQLNAQGQINADLIPPQVVSYNLTNVGGGRTVLVNQIPAVNILQGDTVVEPDDSFVLTNDVLSQYLILDGPTVDYTFQNGDIITSTLTEAITGVVTAPPQRLGIGTQVQEYVGYGTTGLTKGVLLGLQITNGGSGYTNPGIYTAVALTTVTGAGTSAYGTVTIGAGNTATFISAFAGGKGYAVGDVLSAADALVGGRSGGAQFQATVTSVETRLYLQLTNNQKFAGSTTLPDYISDSNAVSISTSLTSNYTIDIDPTDIGTGGNIDFANDRIVVGSGHQFASGDPIVYDANGGTMISASGSGILNLETYYTKPVGVSSVELYYDYSLVNLINLTGSGIGTHTLRRQTVNTGTDKLVIVGHGFTVGDPFRVFGAAPTGITTHEFYFIGAVTQNSFSLHQTQADALLSVNGVSFNPVGMSGTSSGITTLTNQNVRYRAHVNTSSADINNYSLLARDSIDASNIVSGVISPTRLGTGSANSDTVLTGTSAYRKAVFSVGIGTTQPISATATSSDLAPGGIGINTYYGNVNIVLNRVSSVGNNDYSTLGVSRFKTSTFAIGDDGEVSIKSGSSGDINSNTFQGQGPSYYLDAANHTGSVPITRGGTGLTGVPASGAILIGNGSAYSLTTSPTFSGNVTVNATLTATSIVESSDVRLKENIKTIDDALNKLTKLRGVEYDLKSSGQRKLGLIAQEVEYIIPEVVLEDDNSMKSVAYGNIVGLLVESIKELRNELNDVKKSININKN